MKKRMPVSSIMTADPICVNINHEIADVVKIFQENNIHHVPVVEGSRLLGIISKTDLDCISYVCDYRTRKTDTAVFDLLSVEQVMTKELDTVREDTTIQETAKLLVKGAYHALPVMEGHQLKGIITSTDVINYLLE